MAVFFRYPQAGRPALSVQADHAQLPTSTVKLLTTVYIILHELGPESHQHTRILALSVNDGVVQWYTRYAWRPDPTGRWLRIVP